MESILRNRELIPREEGSVDVEDRGYQFGDGVYEVIRFYRGVPFMIDGHLKRFERSARELQIAMPYGRPELADRLLELAAANAMSTGTVYVQLTRGVYTRSQVFPPERVPAEITAFAKNMPRPVAELKDGVCAILAGDIRWLRCDIKSLNLIPNVLARQKARTSGCYEAIQHRGEAVTEGAFSNVFIVSAGTVITPPESNLILSGVTRAKVLELCKAEDLPIMQRALACRELIEAGEVFITSTTNEIMPVTQVDDQIIGSGAPGPVTRQLQEAYERAISSIAGDGAVL